MNIIHTEVDGLWCRVRADGGTFERWPGRDVQGRQYWSYVPTEGRPTVVTVPDTIVELEQAFQAARLALVDGHPSSLPKRPHLTLVPALDWCEPHGIARPA